MAGQAVVALDCGSCRVKESDNSNFSTKATRLWDKVYVAVLRRDGAASVAWFASAKEFNEAKVVAFDPAHCEIAGEVGDPKVEVTGDRFVHLSTTPSKYLTIRLEGSTEDFLQALQSETKADSPTKKRKNTAGSARYLLVRALPEYEPIPDTTVARQFRLKTALSELNRIMPESKDALDFGESFSTICLVGGQSAGKSTLLEYIVGCPCAFRRGGVGTRRPIVYNVLRDNARAVVEYEFPASKKKVNAQDLVDELERLQGEGFQSEAVEVNVSGPGLFTITVVDLPGYVSSDDKASIHKINNVHINRPDALIVLVRRAQDWEGSDDAEARNAVKAVDPRFQRTVVVTTQMSFLFSTIKDSMAHGYLEGRAGGREFYPGAQKFFVGVKLESAGVDRFPVAIPEDAAEAQRIIAEATVDLEESLGAAGVDLGLEGPVARYVGMRRLGEYLRYVIVGDKLQATRWATKVQHRLESYVTAELRAVHLAVSPQDQSEVLHYSVQIYGNAFKSILEGQEVRGGLSSVQEHNKCLEAMQDIMVKDGRPVAAARVGRDVWPVEEVGFEGKDEPLSGAQGYSRFLHREVNEVMKRKITTGPNHLHFKNDKEVERCSGVVAAVSHPTLAQTLVRAVSQRSQDHFVVTTRYVLQRAMYCLVVQPFEATLRQIPHHYDDGKGPMDLTPSDLLAMGLLQPGSTWRDLVHGWICEFVRDWLYPDAIHIGHYLGGSQLMEFGGKVSELLKEHGEEPRIVANAIIDWNGQRFQSTLSTLLEVQVKRRVLDGLPDFLTRRAVSFAGDEAALADVFRDGNEAFLRRKEHLEKIKRLLAM